MATLEYLWRDFEYDNLIHLGRKSKNFNWYCFKC
jgi:hypothetical protein